MEKVAWNWHETFIPMLARILSPQVYVELGILAGATISKVAEFAERAIGVDANTRIPRHGNFEFYQMTTKEFAAKARAENLVIDLLFIDADHSHLQSLEDFEMFSPLVRDLGIILLHDTFPEKIENTRPTLCGEVWRTAEYLRWMGIGEIVTLPVYPGLSIFKKAGLNPWM